MATLAELKVKKRFDEAKAYEAELRKALERDCVIIVRWTGDADVDLLVEEPPGTVCSFRNPRTTAGGVLLGDSISRANDVASPGKTEIYVCPKAFAGNYRMLIKKVWGKRVTTVFPRQGHYATDPKALAGHPPADLTIERIGELLDHDLAGLVAAAK